MKQKFNLCRPAIFHIILISIILTQFACSDKNPQKIVTEFSNPILCGFYPDPSICRVGDDYYLINSSFSYFPGIPIFHSKDLVNWKLIGHAMDRAEQMDLTGLGVSRGIFAPAISYHDGLFYIACTLVDAGGNFVILSKDPAGPWSNPNWLPEINGIDPSVFFDADQKAYIIYNSIPPDNKPLYNGHRTIRMRQFDYKNMSTTGEELILVNGGVDIDKKPVWIEAPHIYKIDDMYYLICAEGGTAEQHSEVIFRSTMITGPYQPWDKNPILTQRNLNPERENPITCTGHADLVQTKSGDWWAVFLGCRPYKPFEKGYFNIGRETFLAPVGWIDQWPVINPDFEEIQYFYRLPVHSQVKQSDIPYSGNFSIRDEFEKDKLHPSWVFLRTPHEKWYDLDKGSLRINLKPETCSGTGNPAFIARRQQHLHSLFSTEILFTPNNESEKAGVVIFQNETHYYFLCKTIIGQKNAIALYQSTESAAPAKELKMIAQKSISDSLLNSKVQLKIESIGAEYSFFYSFNNDWIPLEEHVDGTFIRQVIPNDFAGAMYALYATSPGQVSDNHATFNWTEYNGYDNVFKKTKNVVIK